MTRFPTARSPSPLELRRPRSQLNVGLLIATQQDDGTWSVWQDLRLIRDFDSNHDAEDAVKAEMNRANPEAAARVVFDSENDGFAADVKSREDLEALAAAVGELAKKHPPGD